MLHSAIEILSSYITVKSPYDFYSVETIRWDVVDTFYLCEVQDRWYIVYETDFIDSLPQIANKAKEIFGEDFEVTSWLTKKIPPNATGTVVPIKEKDLIRDNLVLRQEKSPLVYTVITAESKSPKSPHFNPTTYGGASTH